MKWRNLEIENKLADRKRGNLINKLRNKAKEVKKKHKNLSFFAAQLLELLYQMKLDHFRTSMEF